MGGVNPVDGQLLANLPDLGVKEEGRVNDGRLSRDPHLGVVHFRVDGLGLVHLPRRCKRAHTHKHTHTLKTQHGGSCGPS